MVKQGTDNSFSNDYTNVARKYKCCKESYAIYVEGIGTGLILNSLADWQDFGTVTLQDNFALLKKSTLPGTGKLQGSSVIILI
ncbi:MAG: hypothetical protein EOO20_19950 [Chryseobacterium sp.]|nr:MAG: hypothetical protein EOO20_19950 [Chryseobacterium sp.]